MFWPQRYDGGSNDDSDRDFKESVQRDGPRRSRARDKDDNRKRNARVVMPVFSNRNAIDSNPMRMIASANTTRFAPKFISSAPIDAPTAVATIRSSESVSVAPRVACMTTRVA